MVDQDQTTDLLEVILLVATTTTANSNSSIMADPMALKDLTRLLDRTQDIPLTRVQVDPNTHQALVVQELLAPQVYQVQQSPTGQ